MRCLSVIIPMKNEADGLQSLFSELIPTLQGIGMDFEIVCVDDGSTDQTLSRLQELKKTISQLSIVELSRNFGKEAALTAGIFHATGDAVVPLDADLQDPPKLILKMVEHWRDGADVVIAVRKSRLEDSRLKRLTASMFYKLMNIISDVKLPENTGDFRLMDRRVVEALKLLPEKNRFNKGVFAWLGFRTAKCYYSRPSRDVGSSKWSYTKLWSLALDGVTAFSSLPLRVWSLLGVLIAFSAILYAIYLIVGVLFFGQSDVPGYASLMVAVLFSCGINLIGLGIVGEYISRVYIETKGRPLYIVRNFVESRGGSQSDATQIKSTPSSSVSDPY